MDATLRHDAGRRVLPVLVLVLLATMLAACGTTALSPSAPAGQAVPTAAAARPAGQPPQTASATKPAGPSAPAVAAPAKPSSSVEVDREQIAREATWAPGQLQAHVEKHGSEGPWPTEAAFDASARETIRIGTVFTY